MAPGTVAKLNALLHLLLHEIRKRRPRDGLSGDQTLHRRPIDLDLRRELSVPREVILAVVALQLACRPIAKRLRTALPAKDDALPQCSGQRGVVVQRLLLDLRNQRVFTSGHSRHCGAAQRQIASASHARLRPRADLNLPRLVVSPRRSVLLSRESESAHGAAHRTNAVCREGVGAALAHHNSPAVLGRQPASPQVATVSGKVGGWPATR